MPSSAGRYRSRLFNFVSRQTRRWVDRGELAARQVTVATVWGVQILVYPVYLLFQSARLAGKQLQHFFQGLTHPQPDLQPLPADTPIQKVLETVGSFALPVNLSLASLPETLSGGELEKSEVLTVANTHPSDLEVQGIATLPENRHLVLINNQNQILDVLNQQQQHQLEKQISLELAEYLHHQRLVQDASLPTSYLPPPASSENALPPIRFWQKFMAWMQRGKVAGAINLFEEESLQLHQEVKNRELEYRTQRLKQKTQELKERQQELSLRIQNQLNLESASVPEVNDTSLLGKVDRAIATIETGSLAVATNVPSYLTHHSQEFRQLVKARMQELTLESNESPVDVKLKIKLLIKAAVDYFFGARVTGEFPLEETPAINFDTDNLELFDPDFWLTEEELFPEPLPPVTTPQKLKFRSAPTSGVITQEKTVTHRLIETTVFSAGTPEKTLITTKSQLQKHSGSDYNHTTDAIEIQVSSTGYIKHPLEQVLEIVDRTMFLIEEVLLTIWQEIQQLFR